jgi:hypothetical protein
VRKLNVPHEIVIEVTKEGETKTTVEGVAGPACSDLSAFLDMLGVVVEDQPTDDFYQTVEADEEVGLGWSG